MHPGSAPDPGNAPDPGQIRYHDQSGGLVASNVANVLQHKLPEISRTFAIPAPIEGTNEVVFYLYMLTSTAV